MAEISGVATSEAVATSAAVESASTASASSLITSTAASSSTSITIVGTLPADYTNAASCTALTSAEVVLMDSASSCLPDNFNTAASAYYSPAWECPDGYWAPKSCSRSASDDATVHTITCCPSRSNVVMTCVPDAAALSSVWVDLLCTWSAGTEQTVLLVTSTSVLTDGSTTTMTNGVTMSGGDGINAYGIHMIYDESDLSTSTTGSSSKSSSGSVAAQTSGSSNSDSGGLSTGAIAAIAVVIPLVAIAALIGAWFWYRRRKQRQQVAATELGVEGERKELPSEPTHGELYGSQGYVTHELDTPSVAVELPAEDVHHKTADTTTVSSPGLSSAGLKTNATSPSLSVSAVSKSDPSSPGNGNHER